MRDGDVRREFSPSGKVTGPAGEMPCLSPEELELFYECETTEIGKVIYEASFLAPWLVRCFRVPPSSLETLGRIYTFVDASPSTASPTSGKSSDTTKPEEVAAPPDTPNDASKSAEPMAATVEATT